jgi:hypothetical protein
MRHINKYFVALGLALALVGCIVENEGPGDDSNTASIPLESGQTMTVVAGTPDEAQEPIAWSESPSATDDVGAEACWVTLLYCVDPRTGGPTCSFTGCTLAEAIYHCNILIDRYC